MDNSKNSDFLKKAGQLFNDFNSAIASNSRLHKIVTSAVITPVLAVGIMAGSSNVQAATPTTEAPSVQQPGGMFSKLKSGVLSSKSAIQSVSRSALTTAEAAGSKIKSQSDAAVNASSSMAQKLGAASEKLKTSISSNGIVQKVSASTENIKTSIENNAVVKKIDNTTEKLRAGVENNTIVKKVSDTKESLKAAVDDNSMVQKLDATTDKIKAKVESNAVTDKIKASSAVATEKLSSATSAIGAFFKSDGYAAASDNQDLSVSNTSSQKHVASTAPRM